MSDLLQLHIDLFRQFQSDPYKVIDAKLIKIITAVMLDEQGNLVTLDAAPVNRFISDENGYLPPTEYIRTLQFNRPQKMLRAAHRMYQRKGIPFRADLLKARSVGATTFAQAVFAATVATRSGVACLDVAHKPKSTNNIYQIGSNMVKRLPDWIRPSLENDSRELLKTVNPEWGVSESTITNVSCTNIDALRSFRFLMALLDEAAWYENGEEVQAATNSIMMNTPESFLLKATTGNGEDPFFYPEFMSAWQAQGQKNFWEPGVRLFRYPSLAVFFPFYFDTSKWIDPDSVEDYSVALFEQDLTEFEDGLLRERMIPMWQGFGFSASEARRNALCQLYWRRCKVSTENVHMPRPSSVPGGTFTSFKKFAQEEPATVEEAFQSTVGDRVFSDELRRKVQSTVRPPRMKGNVIDGKWVESSSGSLWLWKEPSEVRDVIFSIDPNPGIMDQTDDTTKADYTWGFIMDRETGEQIGEYTSRQPLYRCLKEIYEIALFIRGSSTDLESYPLMVPEIQQGGAQLVNYLLENHYPAMRIYRRPEKEDKAGRNVSTSFGFHTNVQSKPTAINLLVSALHEDKLTVLSPRILDQMLYFVEVRPRVYQAQMKGRGGAASKDDGILAAAIAVYADNYSPAPIPPDFSFDPGGLSATLKPPPMGIEYLAENQKFYEECEKLGINPDSIPRPGWTPVEKKKTTWRKLL